MNRLTLICINATLALFLITFIECLSALALWARPYIGALQEGSPQIDRRILSPVYKDKVTAEIIYREFSNLETSYQSYSVWSQNLFQGQTININETGVRRTCYNPSGDGLKIFMFGGSTMFGTGVADCETIPSLLAREISEKHPNLKFEVINYGVTGYQSTQEIIRLLRLLQTGQFPNHVIFYDGVNDVYAGAYSPGIPGEHQNLNLIKAKWDSGVMSWIKQSNTFQLSTYLFHRYNEPLKPSESVYRAVAKIYESNLMFLDALSVKYQFQYKAFLQPVLLDRSKPPSDFEASIIVRSKSMANAYERTYPELRKIAVTDMSRIFDGISDDMYVDFCHLGAHGNELVAKSIYKSLNL